MDADDRPDTVDTIETPAPPTARVTSVQWVDEPIAAPVPPTTRQWDWPWIVGVAIAGLAAFVGAMAVVTNGFRPVDVAPNRPLAPPPESRPLPTAAPTAAPVSEDVPPPPTLGQRYTQYTNANYGFSVIYPDDYLIAQGESADGSSQAFVSADGMTQVAVGAFSNPTGLTLDEAYREARRPADGREVTKADAGPTWYEVSGVQGSMVFYEKTYLVGDVFRTLAIAYPRQYRGTFAEMAEEMATSFTLE